MINAWWLVPIGILGIFIGWGLHMIYSLITDVKENAKLIKNITSTGLNFIGKHKNEFIRNKRKN